MVERLGIGGLLKPKKAKYIRTEELRDERVQIKMYLLSCEKLIQDLRCRFLRSSNK